MIGIWINMCFVTRSFCLNWNDQYHWMSKSMTICAYVRLAKIFRFFYPKKGKITRSLCSNAQTWGHTAHAIFEYRQISVTQKVLANFLSRTHSVFPGMLSMCTYTHVINGHFSSNFSSPHLTIATSILLLFSNFYPLKMPT